MTRQADDGLIFAGDVYIRNRRTEGGGFYDIGNTTSLSLKTDSEKKQRISRRKASWGQPLDSISLKKPTELKLKLDTFDKTNLAMALHGKESVIEAQIRTVTDEEITVGVKGNGYPLSIDNLDPATVTVKNAAGQAVKAEHLSVNAVLGLITVLPPCDNVNAGEKIKVTAKTLKKGGFKIDADAVPDYDLEIMLDGENRVTGEPVKLHIPSAVVSADSELDWFKDDFNEVSFTGNPVLVAGYESSYSVKVFDK